MVKLISAIVFLALVLTACGDNPTPAPGAVVEVTRIVAPTTSALAATIAPTNTAALTKTTVPATTAVITNTPISSASTSESVKELIGQSGVQYKQKIQVIAADRYKEIAGKNKTAKSEGNFIVTEFSVDNTEGSEDGGIVFADLIDGKGRTFSVISNSEVTLILILEEPYRTKYKQSSSIQPGFKGQAFQVFEVPLDAKDFKIKIGV